jgi:hypothetical protein
MFCFEGTVSRDFFFIFFHESSSPRPLKRTFGSLCSFTKIHRDIRKSRYTTGFNDKGGKFAPVFNYKVAYLPPVSMTLTVNLPLVSTTPVANNGNNIRLLTLKVKLKKNSYL